MNYIPKNSEPAAFTKWKLENPKSSYKNIPKNIKDSIRQSLSDEQGYVCCFCGTYIGAVDTNSGTVTEHIPGNLFAVESCRIAHIKSQSAYPSLALCYNNFGLSCPSQKGHPTKEKIHCDRAQGASTLPIDPQTPDCIENFRFTIDGKIHPNGPCSNEAQTTVDVLNLNAKRLVARRRQALQLIDELLKNDPTITPEGIKNKFNSRRIDGRFAEYYFVILSYFCPPNPIS